MSLTAQQQRAVNAYEVAYDTSIAAGNTIAVAERAGEAAIRAEDEADRSIALRDIANERVRQQQTWGTEPLAWCEWIAVLAEEVGEASQAALHVRFNHELTLADLRTELIQLSAVAVAMVEQIDAETGGEGGTQ